MRYLLTLLATLVFAVPAFAMETEAKQAFMVDAQTGTVLLNKNGDETMHPSSMSKLMTIYIALDRLQSGKLKLTDTFLVSEKAWKMQGSKTFVHVGDTVKVEELLHGIITQSGNDACIVLAEGISGSEEMFVQEMNRVAQELGLSKSHFTNATGWPDEGHLMSSRDLATLAKQIIEKFPEYYPYFALSEFTYNKITQPNRNRLLGVLGIDGLKTGHTEVAGYGITLSARQGDRRLILVINGLGSENKRLEEGRRLLQYGFSAFENVTILKAGATAAEADVWFGEQKTVPLTSEHDVVMTLPTAGKAGTRFTLKYQGPLTAPVEKGAHVADLVVSVPGQEPQVIPLTAGQTVEELTGFSRIPAMLDYYIFNRMKGQ